MSLFRHALTRRRIAGVVLLAFLFASAAAWANACLLQARSTHLDNQSSELAGPTSVVSAGHAGVVPGHTDDGTNSSSSAPCNKVCADESHTPVKSIPDVDSSVPGPALLAVIAWDLADPMAVLSPHRLRLQRPIAAQPIRVRFSRLAL